MHSVECVDWVVGPVVGWGLLDGLACGGVAVVAGWVVVFGSWLLVGLFLDGWWVGLRKCRLLHSALL